MKLTFRRRTTLAIAGTAVLVVLFAQFGTARGPRHDARAIYEAVPLDSTLDDVVRAIGLPPGSYSSRRGGYISMIGSGAFTPSCPSTYHSWHFTQGVVIVRASCGGRIYKKEFCPYLDGGVSPFAWLKRVTGLDRWL